MKKTFQTFETFEPKRVGERTTKRLEKIMSVVNSATEKVTMWQKSKQEIEDTNLAIGDYLEFYYLKMSSEKKVASISKLQQILDIMEKVDMNIVKSSSGTHFSLTAIEMELDKAQKLQKQRMYSFNLSHKLRTNNKGNESVFEIGAVIFYVENKIGTGKSYTIYNGPKLFKIPSIEGHCMPNGKDNTIVLFETHPKVFEKILDALKDSGVTIVKDPDQDYYTLS